MPPPFAPTANRGAPRLLRSGPTASLHAVASSAAARKPGRPAIVVRVFIQSPPPSRPLSAGTVASRVPDLTELKYQVHPFGREVRVEAEPQPSRRRKARARAAHARLPFPRDPTVRCCATPCRGAAAAQAPHRAGRRMPAWLVSPSRPSQRADECFHAALDPRVALLERL